jgi:hypothetical protein
MTTINAYGLESYPSKVMGPEDAEWDIEPENEQEM